MVGRPPLGAVMPGAIVAALVLALQTAAAPAADLDREARAIDELLVAPCCYSQQVSVHQSAAAEAVRRDVRARLAAGQRRDEIVAVYVAQYGKRILAEPPATGFDLTLYVLPVVLFFATLAAVAGLVRRMSRPVVVAGGDDTGSLSSDERSRLDEELRDLD